MSTPRRLAALVCGRRTKWLVLALWVVLAGVGGVYGPKLTEAQVNDAASFLPADSESTQVIELQAAFTGGQETVPAVVVYERTSGITPEDFAAAKGQAAEMAALPLVEEDVVGPIPSEDGQALQVIVPITFEDGFELGEAVTDLRAITADSPEGLTALVGGPAGLSGDIFEAFGDINGTLLLGTILVVILVLLVTYRSPVLWIVPLLAVALADQLAQAINYFLADAGLIVVNGQTPEHPDGAGLRRRHRLRAAADRPLPRGAAAPRGPPRGDGRGAAPGRARRDRRRGHRGDRPDARLLFADARAPPAVSGRSAPSASRCALLRDDHPAAGPARALRPLGLLAVHPALRHARPHEESGFFGRIGRGIAREPRLIWVGTALVLGLVALNAVNIDANGLSTAES